MITLLPNADPDSNEDDDAGADDDSDEDVGADDAGEDGGAGEMATITWR